MVTMTPRQLRIRERFEALLGIAAPALDLMLAAGDRASRWVGGEDHDFYPVGPPGEVFELPPVRGGRSRPEADGEPAYD
jgi:hypothetical protein